MSLYLEVKDLVQGTFGDFSAKKIDEFKGEINPDVNPKEFLDKCVDFMSTLLGEDMAKDKLQPFYAKYVK